MTSPSKQFTHPKNKNIWLNYSVFKLGVLASKTGKITIILKTPKKLGVFYFIPNCQIAIKFIFATLFHIFFSRSIHMLVERLKSVDQVANLLNFNSVYTVNTSNKQLVEKIRIIF